MKTRTMLVVFSVLIVSIIVVGQVLAAGTYYNYNLTVPKLGIGYATTSNRQKVNSADTATVCSQGVGGGYTIRASIRLSDGTQAAAYQNISDLQRRNYTLTPSAAGTLYHARLASSGSVPVNVQALGWWSPDNPGACGF